MVRNPLANMPIMTTPPDDQESYYTTLEPGRVHAPYFALSPSKQKQDNEFNVATTLSQELTKRGKESFHSIKSRGEGYDPPDCEARDGNGKRIGIEVTELVHEYAIAPAKEEDIYKRDAFTFSEEEEELYKKGGFTSSEVIKHISGRIEKKDKITNRDGKKRVQGGPYDEYILIICCDDYEYFLNNESRNAMRKAQFGPTRLITRAYFLESYCPLKKCHPYIDLHLLEPPAR